MNDAPIGQEPYLYPRFSLAERNRRWAAVRKLMAIRGIDVIVAPQNTGHSMDFQADARYLTHCGGGGDADALVPALAEWFRSPDFRGCAFINSVGELGAETSQELHEAREGGADRLAVVDGCL